MHFLQQLISTSLRASKGTIFQSLKCFCVSTSLRALATPPGKFIDVDGYKIHYEKLGHGDHVVLFLPGAVGSSRLDYGPLEKMDPDKFTVLVWDPPGYGFSRPPDRTFPLNYLQRDADVAAKFVKALGVTKLSVAGWCNGGCTAIIFAGLNPDMMKKLIVVSCHVLLEKEDLEWCERHRNIISWNESVREERVKIYGEKYLHDTWSACVDAYNAIYDQKKGDLCATEAKLVTCPTLLLRGMKDNTIPRRHFDLLANTIKHAEIIEMKETHHGVPIHKPDEFYNIVQSYLLK